MEASDQQLGSAATTRRYALVEVLLSIERRWMTLGDEPEDRSEGVPSGDFRSRLGMLVALVWASVAVYLALRRPLPAHEQLATHLAFGMSTAFLLGGKSRSKTSGRFWRKLRPWLTGVLPAVLSATVWIYSIANFVGVAPQRVIRPEPLDLVFGVVAILLVLAAAWRMVGPPLGILVAIGLGYVLLGQHIPGYFGHAGFPPERIIGQLYMRMDGILGVATGASANVIFPIVIFGAFMMVFGVNDLIKVVSHSIFAGFQGSTSKVCITSSAMFGMVSGSGPGNAAQTGVYTIPLMKQAGYKREEAAGIESVASVGGDVVPPIMGASAFVMAQFLEVPYAVIVQAALIPAFLYFLTIHLNVDFLTRRNDIDRASDSGADWPAAFRALLSGWHFVIPIGILIYGLVGIQISPARAAAWSICTLVVSDIGRRLLTRQPLDLPRLPMALIQGAKMGSLIAVATATVDIFIRSVGFTGIGLKVTTALTSGDHPLLLVLILVAAASIVMGTGLPGLAVYLVAVILVGPVLISLGVAAIVAHFFVYYYGNLGGVTPPTALAPYVAAGIAGASPLRTQWVAIRLSLFNFALPVAFVYRPELILHLSIVPTLVAVISVTAAAVAFACAISGYCGATIGRFARLGFAAVSLLLLFPLPAALGGAYLDVLAALTLIGFVGLRVARGRTARAAVAVDGTVSAEH